ncbi:hypothetical protein ACH5RR_017797, partial [Cinchona calisaya]
MNPPRNILAKRPFIPEINRKLFNLLTEAFHQTPVDKIDKFTDFDTLRVRQGRNPIWTAFFGVFAERWVVVVMVGVSPVNVPVIGTCTSSSSFGPFFFDQITVFPSP